MQPAKYNYTVLKQICQHIPAHLVPKLARDFGVDQQARIFHLGHTLWLCCMFSSRTVFRSMTWLTLSVITREF